MRLMSCLFVLLLGGFAMRAEAAGAVLVVNSAAASLSVIDMATQKETRRIAVLREPHHVMLTPDHAELLVGDTVGNEILVLDPASFALKRRMAISDPYQMGFSPDGRYFVVNGLARAQVDVYQAGSYRLVKRFALKSMPSHMDFSADGGVVFISLQGSNRLAAIDLRALEVLWTAPTGRAPAGVMVQNGRVLVANMGDDDVSVLDARDGRTVERIRTGKGPHQLFRSPDRKLIYVNNRIDSTTVALDATSLRPVRAYKLPGGPDDMVFAPDGHIWLTMRFAHKVAVLDPVSGAFSTIDVGRSPHGIFLNPRGVP